MTAPGREFGTDAGGATVTGILAATEFHRGDVVAERFRIERLLGMGGMGVVYQARDLKLDVDVALKLLRPELASKPDAFERFRQELLLARQVSSPHVVRIHDLVQHGAVWLISMDYVPGASLERLLDQKGTLPADQALTITRQLAQGLMAAHQRGVVHRDLKPANVLLNEAGEALITDFGVARSAGATGITGSGVVIGTPEYLSPEQARAERVDGRSDLYALGLMLYEMLCGKVPFSGGTPAEMLAQRIVRNPPPVTTVNRDVPALAARVCERLLELRPALRFQSAEEVVRAIDAGRVPVSAATWRRRGVVAVALLLVLVAAWPAWRAWQSRDIAATTAVPARAQRDLALLPVIALPDAGIDDNLARGLSIALNWRASLVPGWRVVDAEQLEHALADNGLDARAARRFRDKLATSVEARALAEWDIEAAGDKTWRARLTIRDAGAAEPRWRAESDAVTLEQLPKSCVTLLDRWLDQQRLRAPTSTIADIATLSWLGAVANGDADALTQAKSRFDAATDDGLIAWTWLRALDRLNRPADAESAAADVLARADTPTQQGTQLARGFAQILVGDDDAARAILTTLLATHGDDARVRWLDARAWAALGDYSQAQDALRRVVDADPRDARAWFELGKFTLMAGEAQQAVGDYLVRAQVLGNRFGDARLLAEVTNALGIGYRQMGRLEPAAESFEKAARERGALGDARGQAVSLRNLATVQGMLGRYDDATQALDHAREIVLPLGDAAAAADVVNDVGVLAEERGDYTAALEAYREALNFRRGGGDARLIGESLINVGFAYYQLGDFDNAEVYWQQAQDEYARIDDRAGQVRARQSLGLTHTARGDWKAAREALESSLHDAEDLQLADEKAVALASLAELDRLEGHYRQALMRADEAAREYQAREDARGITELALTHAAIALDLGDREGARATLAPLNEAEIGSQEQVAMLWLRRAELALEDGKPEDAERDARAALDVATKAHGYGHELAARLWLARAAQARGRAADARRALNESRQGLGRFASVPLRLLLLESALAIDAGQNDGDYREARARLAKLTAYGRAWRIHAEAARYLRGAPADEARAAANSALATVIADTPEAQAAALREAARARDLAPAAETP